MYCQLRVERAFNATIVSTFDLCDPPGGRPAAAASCMIMRCQLDAPSISIVQTSTSSTMEQHRRARVHQEGPMARSVELYPNRCICPMQ